MHKAGGVTEPRTLQYGLCRMAHDDILGRKIEALRSLASGLCPGLSVELMEPLLARLEQREYQNVNTLNSTYSAVHRDSMWNVEVADSVVVIPNIDPSSKSWNPGEMILLNARFDNNRRSAFLDPMQNLARYTFLCGIDTTLPDEFMNRIDGEWLLTSYFDEMGWSVPSRVTARARFYAWLDLEYILYFNFFLASCAHSASARVVGRAVRALCTIEKITMTAFPISNFGQFTPDQVAPAYRLAMQMFPFCSNCRKGSTIPFSLFSTIIGSKHMRVL
jgi:hypothetical protein